MSFELGSGKKVNLHNVNDIKASDADCFLTTACIRNKALPDDCNELTTLQIFRDTVLLEDADGKSLVKEYYQIAPQIVTEINQYSNIGEIWSLLYDKLVTGTTTLVSDKHNERLFNIIYSI